MPLRLASFHAATWDYTLYSEGFLAPFPSNGGMHDTLSAFISIDELIHHPPLDPALIPIDVQAAFAQAQWGSRNNPAMERNGQALLAAWRQRDMPLIHVRHDSTHLVDDGAVPIAVGAMTLVAVWLHTVNIDPLNVPDSFRATTGRSWVLDPFRAPMWVRIAASALRYKIGCVRLTSRVKVNAPIEATATTTSSGTRRRASRCRPRTGRSGTPDRCLSS